ncbi:MAG: MATE family efflux transporter [Planctomycetaceae bacterium]|nr:MAG: MATE family efflux transporter [Planctomycetaceae bacterium]
MTGHALSSDGDIKLGVMKLHEIHEVPGLSGAPAGSLSELLRVALPLILSSGVQSLMHIIDRIYLTWYSGDAIAAALPAGMVYWTILSLPYATASYVNTFVAQYDGAGRPDRVTASLAQGVWFSLIVGSILLTVAPWAEPLFQWMGHAPQVAQLEAIYFRWLVIGSPVALLQATLSTFFSGRGQTRVVLLVSTLGVSINAVLDYCLIFGWGPFPRLGIAGAALTDVLGNLLAAIMYTGLIATLPEARAYLKLPCFRWEGRLLADLLRFGGPSGMQGFIDTSAFALFMMMLGWLGPESLKASNIAFNLNTLTFIPIIGLGQAVSTIVGQRIGEGRAVRAVRSVHWGCVLGGSYMALFAILYLGVPDWLLWMYEVKATDPDFPRTREKVKGLLRYVATYSFFDALSIVYGSAIRGAGDTRFAMVTALLGAWLVMVLPVYVMHRAGILTLDWCWMWCTLYAVLLGIIFWRRFQSGVWQTKQVIRQDVVMSTISAETTAVCQASSQL